MANVYVEARKKGRFDGDPVDGYVFRRDGARQ
jgi:hypothetical protein